MSIATPSAPPVTTPASFRGKPTSREVPEIANRAVRLDVEDDDDRPVRRVERPLIRAEHDPTWDLIDSWLDVAGTAGERFGVGDLLVAAIAADCESAIWSLDADFRRMDHLGFVSVYEPTSGH